MEVHRCLPTELTEANLRQFHDLVLTGGEVSAIGLTQRIRDAQSLAVAVAGGNIIGTAALKHPHVAYHRRVFEKAQVDLRPDDFPLELGWVFVRNDHREQGVSGGLLQALLEGVTTGLYSTSRTDNVPMHRALQRFGFLQRGQSYPSKQNRKALLSLFVRSAKT